MVLPKSWTRFSYIYKWDGKPLFLSSRAYDDFGNVQPTIDEETKAVGVESVYHRNAIVTWEITSKESVIMFTLENITKLKGTLLALSLAILVTGCNETASKKNESSVDGAVKYPIKDGKYTQYHVNTQKLDGLNIGRDATKKR